MFLLSRWLKYTFATVCTKSRVVFRNGSISGIIRCLRFISNNIKSNMAIRPVQKAHRKFVLVKMKRSGFCEPRSLICNIHPRIFY